jgi:hypothetical protein
MRAHFLVAIVFLTVFAVASAAEVRDGSSFERAILVQGDYEHSVDWEWAYLKKLFWGRGMPKEHGLMQHNGRWYDRFVFSTSGGDKVVYFDVTRFAGRITRKHGAK